MSEVSRDELRRALFYGLDFQEQHEKDMLDFMMGVSPVSVLDPWVYSEYRDFKSQAFYDKLEAYQLKHPDPVVQRRGTILLMMNLISHIYCQITFGLRDQSQKLAEMKKLLSCCQQEGIDIRHQILFLTVGYKEAVSLDLTSIRERYISSDSDKGEHEREWTGCAFAILQDMIGQNRQEVVDSFSHSDTPGRLMGIKFYRNHTEDYKQEILSFTKDNSKAVRELLYDIILAHPEWKADIKERVTSRKKAERELAEKLLADWGNSETDKDDFESDQLVQAIHKGRKKTTLSWIQKKGDLPEVHDLKGRLVSEAYLQAICLYYAVMLEQKKSEEASILAGKLNQQELEQYAGVVFERWIEDGAQIKRRWVLTYCAIHGGVSIIEKYMYYIRQWMLNDRGVLAKEALGVLIYNPFPQAFWTLDEVAQRNPVRTLRVAARWFVNQYASEYGAVPEELAERFLMDTASDISLKNQVHHLETAFIHGRCWNAKQWKRTFIQNEAVQSFTQTLIWGVYKDQELIRSFRYMEDGSYTTETEEEYDLPEEGTIKLVHPMDLSQESITAWKEHLSDYEIIQPFDQMGRSVYSIREEEKNATILKRFAGCKINAQFLDVRLTEMYWFRELDGRNSWGDSLGRYYKDEPNLNLRVRLSLSKVNAARMSEEDFTVGEMEFFRLPEKSEQSFFYGRIMCDYKDKLTLGELPPRYFSEIIWQLTRATEL